MDRLISDERDLKLFITFLQHQKLPFTVKVTSGRHRSIEQNKLSHMWYAEIAQHYEDRTPQQVKAECKLLFGMPILCAGNERFREAYQREIAPLPYERKVRWMEIVPATSIMTTKQLTEYLDQVSRYFTEQGVQLTHPDDLGRAA